MLALLVTSLLVQVEDQKVGSFAHWFGQSDYPPSLVRDRVEGTVGIEFVIDVNGLVPECRIVESSGNQLLDDTTCNIIKRRGRYRPALDSQRKPIAVLQTKRIIWALPENAHKLTPQK